MTRKHLPPPTKFGPGGTAQRTAAPSIGTGMAGGHPRPFPGGAAHPGGAVHRVGQPAAMPPGAPHNQNHTPPKPPVPVHRPTGAPPPGHRPVIQRMEARENIPITLDTTLHPANQDHYKNHVYMRIKIFALVLVRLIALIRSYETEHGKITGPITSFMAKKANVQAGKGFRIKSDNKKDKKKKFDAAHLVNVSVESSAILRKLQKLTSIQKLAVRELRIITSSTTTQYQTDNVGPDKVIDTCMTLVSQKILSEKPSLLSPSDVITSICTLCLRHLSSHKNSKKLNYIMAAETMSDILSKKSVKYGIDAIADEIEYDLLHWKKDHELT